MKDYPKNQQIILHPQKLKAETAQKKREREKQLPPEPVKKGIPEAHLEKNENFSTQQSETQRRRGANELKFKYGREVESKKGSCRMR